MELRSILISCSASLSNVIFSEIVTKNSFSSFKRRVEDNAISSPNRRHWCTLMLIRTGTNTWQYRLALIAQLPCYSIRITQFKYISTVGCHVWFRNCSSSSLIKTDCCRLFYLLGVLTNFLRRDSQKPHKYAHTREYQTECIGERKGIVTDTAEDITSYQKISPLFPFFILQWHVSSSEEWILHSQPNW